MTLDKTVEGVEDANGNGITDAGDVVSYEFLTTNTGTTTVSNVTVSETFFSGTGAMSALTCSPVAPGILASGESMTCSATYTLTQADVDARVVTNTATAAGQAPNPADPDNPIPVVSPPDSVEVSAGSAPVLAVEKSVDSVTDANGNGLRDAGDVVTYLFVASNPGTVTVRNVQVTETAFSGTGTLSGLDCTPSAPVALAPGAELTCSATYVLTQADVDAGVVTNTALAGGDVQDPEDPTASIPVTSPPDSAGLPVDQVPGLELVKTVDGVADNNGNGRNDPGDVVTYRFVTTNSGTVTVANVAVQEVSFSGTGALSALTCTPLAPATLAPGEVMDCIATYTISTADAAAGEITNIAIATGEVPDPSNPTEVLSVATEPSDAQVSTEPTPSDPGGSLAFTGAALGWLPGLAAIFLVVGIALTVVAKRRTSA